MNFSLRPQENLHNSAHTESRNIGLPVQEATAQSTSADPINHLEEVLADMNNKLSAQTLMVRPVNNHTDFFRSDVLKIQLLEDVSHTMRKMQPNMAESKRKIRFHSLLRKNAQQIFPSINRANSQTLEDLVAVFLRKYVKPESRATAKHKWHKLIFNPNTMKLPDFPQ